MADMLAEPEDLAALLQIDDLDRATAELLLECATAVVQQAAGGQRILLVEDDVYTTYLDHLDSPYWLALPQRPVVEVTSVQIGTTTVSDWAPQYNRNRIYRLGGWRLGNILQSASLTFFAPTPVTVTYTHGYAPGDQKLQLARSAALSFAAGGYDNPTSAQREQIDDYAVQYAEMTSRMEATPALRQALRQQYGRGGNSVRLVRSH